MDLDQMDVELLKLASDARKLEIENFWKRSLFFWGFIVAAFAGYAFFSKGGCALSSRGGNFEFERAILLHFGFFCSICWFLINSGSKFWYQAWETKTKELGPGKKVFDKSENAKETAFWALRFSPSRVTICLSLVTCIAWLAMIIWNYYGASEGPPAIVISSATLVLVVLLVWQCKRPLKEQ
jgi:hypothetical protein